MMHKKMNVLVTGLALVSTMAIGTPAWSQEEDTIAARTERTESEVTKGALQREVVGIKPQAGLMVFDNANGDTDSRAAGAIIVEMNAMTTFFKDQPIANRWYLGPSTGVVYSHLGDPSSNFFGTSASTAAGQAGSNFVMIPLNLKLGYLIPDSNFRVSVRGGGNFTYRSVGDSMFLGNATRGADSKWRIYPNVGADIELGQLVIRPDLTLTPGNDVFTGTVGFNIALG